jgi:hypothetical protein
MREITPDQVFEALAPILAAPKATHKATHVDG